MRPNLPVSPEELRANAPLTAALVATDFNEIPVSAKCVTFTFVLTQNPGTATPNVAQFFVEWAALDPTPAQPDVVSRAVLLDGTSFDPATCTITGCAGVWNGPGGTVAYDFTFPIPAGKDSVRLQVVESGDVAEPGDLRVLIAYQGSSVGT